MSGIKEILESGQFPGLAKVAPRSQICPRHGTLEIYGQCRRCGWEKGRGGKQQRQEAQDHGIKKRSNYA